MVTSSSSNSWILSLKILLASIGVVSVAVTAKLAFPVIFNFAVNDLPVIWSVIVSWLEPPYLYVIINGIIIIIVASTRFQTNHHQEINQSQQQVVYNYPSDLRSDLPPVSILNLGVMEAPPVSYDINPSVTVEPQVAYSKRADLDVDSVAVGGPEGGGGIADDFITTRSTWNPSHSLLDSPRVTSRFAHNRKPAKYIPEGARTLRVLKQKKHETLESTWKMITEGRRMPSTRRFRKSDTFENLHYDRPSDESTAAETKVVNKSETFKDRTAYENQNHYPQPSSENSSPASAGKLKKELSLSQDELNRRVEAFIKKFNDDMRLQRQESLNRYLESGDG